MINQRYEIIGLIGEGGFAKVFLAEDTKMEIKVALKRYDPSKFIAKVRSQSTGAKVNAEKYSVLSEIKRGIGLTHTNLIRYYDAFAYTEKSSFGDEKYEVGIMEYLNDGDWMEFVEKYGVHSKEFKEAVKGVLSGLSYLHKHHIIHRDIKPPNILFNDTIPKITDLGISKDVNTGSSESSVLLGTVEYMSPEQISPEDFGINKNITYNADFWAFGIVLYKSFLNKMPFGSTSTGMENETIRKNIISESYKIPDLDKIPEPYKEIVEKCLVRQASGRIKTAEDIFKLLQDTPPPPPPPPENEDETDVVTNNNNNNNENGEKKDKDKVTILPNYILYFIAAFLLVLAGFLLIPKLFDKNKKTSGKNIAKEEKNRKSTNNEEKVKEIDTKPVVHDKKPDRKYSPVEENKLLSKYFKKVFDSDKDESSNFNTYKKYQNDINKLFTNDAKIKDKDGSLYNVNDFFFHFISNKKLVDSFKISGHKNNKISYLKIN